MNRALRGERHTDQAPERLPEPGDDADELDLVAYGLGCQDPDALRTLIADDTLRGAALRSRARAIMEKHPVLQTPGFSMQQPSIDAGAGRNHDGLPGDPHQSMNEELRSGRRSSGGRY